MKNVIWPNLYWDYPGIRHWIPAEQQNPKNRHNRSTHATFMTNDQSNQETNKIPSIQPTDQQTTKTTTHSQLNKKVKHIHARKYKNTTTRIISQTQTHSLINQQTLTTTKQQVSGKQNETATRKNTTHKLQLTN